MNQSGPEKANEVLAYSADGKPLTLEQYRAHLERGMQDIKEGRYMCSDELAKEMLTW